jgi:hypothetical protein
LELSERQLERHFGEKFSGLDEARKTYLIDAIKDKIAADPEKFGLTDPDKLQVGQKIDFSSIFEDKTATDQIFEKAQVLTEEQTENILKNNEILREWVKEHPGEALTSEKVEEILHIPPAETFTAEITEETKPEEAPEIPVEEKMVKEDRFTSELIENTLKEKFGISSFEYEHEIADKPLADIFFESEHPQALLTEGESPNEELLGTYDQIKNIYDNLPVDQKAAINPEEMTGKDFLNRHLGAIIEMKPVAEIKEVAPLVEELPAEEPARGPESLIAEEQPLTVETKFLEQKPGLFKKMWNALFGSKEISGAYEAEPHSAYEKKPELDVVDKSGQENV